MPTPTLPTVVIGGYLGAGKTTLINHLLRQADGRRIAVLVNDFGDINIDADLIVGAQAGVLSLSGGCLCCSFGDDLVGTLLTLCRRDPAGAPAPDLCLIELSGVALPTAVVRTLRLVQAIDVVGTLVLADAADIQRLAADRYVGDTVHQQLAAADWLLLNKPDLVDAAALQARAAWLAALVPSARLMVAAATELPGELFFGWRRDESSPAGPDTAFAARPISRGAPGTSPFASRSEILQDGTDLHALGRRLVDPALGVLRAKGLARDGGGTPQLLQVAGGRWAVTGAEAALPAGAAGRLVVIGLRDAIERWPP